ncbi:GNAT family N-acetyltransferase [Nocardia acidivorans]|uniref:GNAT family N-acetyltransferase n=1 Tax=Nocardia acidivorans TaxID=404580 RepID=UPI00082BAD0E|nr:GNAT family N-acetyltransferase [Nocardia acidivorans]
MTDFGHGSGAAETPDFPGPVHEIGPATAADGPGITRVHLLATRDTFQGRPNNLLLLSLDEFLLTDFAPRKLAMWTDLGATGDPGLLVARTIDGEVAGFIHSGIREDEHRRIGVIEAWYVHPDWHGHGVGRDLMRSALDYLERAGAEQIHADTTGGTKAVERYEGHGFRQSAEVATVTALQDRTGIPTPQILMVRDCSGSRSAAASTETPVRRPH